MKCDFCRLSRELIKFYRTISNAFKIKKSRLGSSSLFCLPRDIFKWTLQWKLQLTQKLASKTIYSHESTHTVHPPLVLCSCPCPLIDAHLRVVTTIFSISTFFFFFNHIVQAFASSEPLDEVQLNNSLLSRHHSHFYP